MNETQAEAALTQARSDIRTLIEGAEYDAGAAWHPLGTVAILFIAACQQPKEVGDVRRPPHDLIDKEFDTRIRQAIAQYDRRASAVRSSEESETYCRRILDWLDLVDLTTPEGRRRAASVFEDAVRFAVERHGKHLGEFITPEPVAKGMLELAEIAPGQTVYDPCFGLGEILVGAARRLSGTVSDSQHLSAPRGQISGCDTNLLAHCVTRCRLVLTGIDSVSLELEDALKRTLPGDGAATGFDRVLAAPPWGKGSIKSQYEHFPFPSAHAEDLFLQHVMAHLQPGGRAVVALPERTLVHADSSALRKELLSRYCVEGVVALPPGAFEPCTSIAMNLVGFSRAQPRDTVRFLSISPVIWGARNAGHLKNLAVSSAPHFQSWVTPVQDLVLRDYELIAKKSGSEMPNEELGRLAETAVLLRVKRLDEVVGVWKEAVQRAFAALKDIDSIPEGSGRLVVLEFAAARFREALGALDGAEEPVGERLRSETRRLVGSVEEQVHAMQRKGRLDIGAEPAEVHAGAAHEVRLRVTNPSPVPLRNVLVLGTFTGIANIRTVRGVVLTADRAVVGEVPYLAEGQRHEIPLVVRAQDDTQPLHIDVTWQARRLDATPVEGRTTVSVLVRSGNEAATVATGDLGASPYIVGNPVDRDEMFFGRDGIMDQIRRQLGGEHANVILLEGNRRTGKTSILRQLEKEDALPGWVPVYCSFQDLDSMATPNLFRLLAKQTGWTLADAGIETWIPDAPPRKSGRPFKLAFLAALRGAFSGGHPYETLALYLAAATAAAKPRRVLLMLDEFDKLQEGIDGGITSPQVPENIRHLLQHQPGLGTILTGSRRLKRLREEYWSALFGFGHRIGVSALPEEEARRLVTEPVAGRIRYLPQARDGLVARCARHPFLIQSLSSRVFDQAAAGSERTITGDLVDRAATEMVRDNEHFQTLWGYAGSERRRLILALSERMADAPDPVNLDLIAMKLDEYRVPVRDDQALADDITELRELELLEIDESYRGGTYRLATPLMAEWLRTNVVFADLVERARQEAIRHA